MKYVAFESTPFHRYQISLLQTQYEIVNFRKHPFVSFRLLLKGATILFAHNDQLHYLGIRLIFPKNKRALLCDGILNLRESSFPCNENLAGVIIRTLLGIPHTLLSNDDYSLPFFSLFNSPMFPNFISIEFLKKNTSVGEGVVILGSDVMKDISKEEYISQARKVFPKAVYKPHPRECYESRSLDKDKSIETVANDYSVLVFSHFSTAIITMSLINPKLELYRWRDPLYEERSTDFSGMLDKITWKTL